MCLRNREFNGGSCTPNSCSGGTSLEFSNTTCVGVTTDVCDYTCEAGFHASGVHICGVDGNYTGGSCLPNACTAGLAVDNSSYVCSGTTGDQCFYTCHAGYTLGHPHVCESDGAFRGGVCLSDRCTNGLRIRNSPTVCAPGLTEDVCEYTCDPGHTPTGPHICTAGTDGYFTGGGCNPDNCPDGLEIDNSPTTCSGSVNAVCDYACDESYEPAGLSGALATPSLHVCNSTGYFVGGDCEQFFACADDDSYACHPDNTRCRKQSIAPLATRSGRTCSCDDGYWELISTRDADECLAWTECYMATHSAVYTVSAHAAAIASGANIEYETVAGTRTSDRACVLASKCGPGTFVWDVPSDLTDTVCAYCETGTYLNNTLGFESVCPRCPAGRFGRLTRSNADCVVCGAGKFQFGSGRDDCVSCAPNSYDDDSSPITVCSACDIGYSAGTGSTRCIANSCDSGLTLQVIAHTYIYD